MARSRLHLWLAVIALPIGLLVAFVAGLFTYMRATATPIHPVPAAIPSAASGAPLPKWAAAIAQGRQAVRDAIAAQNLPGMSVAVGVGGTNVWAEGFGYADLDRRTTVTPATRFRIGGVSIPLTSAAAGLLLQDGRLHLDDEIQMYVPAFPRKRWPVTVRQLMGHTAGVIDDGGDEEPLVGQRCARTVDALERFADRSLLFEPGTKFHASSFGWILVSAAIEAAAGEPFFTFMRTRVFEPLGMTATRPDSSKETIPDRATFYYPRFAANTWYGPQSAGDGDQACFAGAAAFLSTPSDLVKFATALDGGALLRPSTVATLQTSQRLTSGKETGYGLGWVLETIPLAGRPARMAGHDSKRGFIGGTATLLTFPDRGLVVAVTSNISFADTRTPAVAIAQAFAEPTAAR